MGPTQSADFPITPAAYDPTFNGVRDAWAADHDLLPSRVRRYGASTTACGPTIHMGVTRQPTSGDPGFTLTCTDAPAGAQGVLLLGAGQDPPGCRSPGSACT